MIVEVEAYIGESDPACHAAPGPTRRNAPLYGPPGIAYVYLNYGMHYLVNAVTEPEGSPAAVLIRALEPLEGEDLMRRRRARGPGRRPASFSTPELCRGPGNLTRALGISLRDNQRDLTSGPLRIESRDIAGARAGLEPPHRDQRGCGNGVARRCAVGSRRGVQVAGPAIGPVRGADWRAVVTAAACARRTSARSGLWPTAIDRCAAIRESTVPPIGASASMRMKCVGSSIVTLLKLTMMSYWRTPAAYASERSEMSADDDALGVGRLEFLGNARGHRRRDRCR